MAESPVLAAADTWRAADQRRKEAEQILRSARTEQGTEYQAARRSYDMAWDQHWRALYRLYASEPTTLEDASALLAVIVESDDGTLEHPGIPQGLAAVLRCLRMLGGTASAD